MAELTPEQQQRLQKAGTPGGQQWSAPAQEVDESGQPVAPEAPDIQGGAQPGSLPPIGGQSGPPKPSTAQRVAGFISNGQGTPGSVWRGILSGALSGMVAGGAQRHFGSGMAAGGQAANQAMQQRMENRLQMTQAQQEAKLKQAQIVKMQHDVVASSWELANKQAVAAEEHAQFENNLKKFALDTPGAIDLGVVRNPDDLAALHKQYPDLPANIAKANVFSVPHFTPVMDADGKPTGEMKYDGVSAIYVPQDYLNQKIDHDMQVPVFVPGKSKDEAGHYDTQTIKAGTVTNRDAMALLSSRSAEAAKYDNEAAMAKAQAALARAQAASRGKPGELDDADMQTLAHQLATRPTMLKLTDIAGLKKDVRSKILAKALRENPDFDEKAFTVALKTVEDFTTGDAAKNLTAFNGAIRHLSLLGDAAAAMNNGDTMLLNRYANELGAQVGKDNLATYNAIHAAVTGEVGKVYKGSSPTNQEIETMDRTFEQAQTPKQAAAAVRTTMQLMGEKVQDYYRRFRNGTKSTPEEQGIELVNPDVQQTMQRWVGGTINPNAPPGPAPGARPVMQNGKIIGYTTDGKSMTPVSPQ